MSRFESWWRNVGLFAELVSAGVLGVGGTVVTGSGSDEAAAAYVAVRVARVANRIKSILVTLNSLFSANDKPFDEFPAVASTIEKKFEETIGKILNALDYGVENGVPKVKPVPRWPPRKQEAWERYLRNRPDGKYANDPDGWSKRYDTLMANRGSLRR